MHLKMTSTCKQDSGNTRPNENPMHILRKSHNRVQSLKTNKRETPLRLTNKKHKETRICRTMKHNLLIIRIKLFSSQFWKPSPSKNNCPRQNTLITPESSSIWYATFSHAIKSNVLLLRLSNFAQKETSICLLLLALTLSKMKKCLFLAERSSKKKSTSNKNLLKKSPRKGRKNFSWESGEYLTSASRMSNLLTIFWAYYLSLILTSWITKEFTSWFIITLKVSLMIKQISIRHKLTWS